jgi:hypothetical protein
MPIGGLSAALCVEDGAFVPFVVFMEGNEQHKF